MTLEIVQNLTNEANKAARDAIEVIRPAHDKALAAAMEWRDNLADNTNETQKIRRLVGIIESATDKRKQSKEAGAAIAGQYIGGITSVRQISLTQQRDGKYWLNTLARYSHDWPQEQRLRVLDAFVMACQGKVTAGLLEFPSSLVDALDIHSAETLAELADPSGYAKYKAEQAALADEYGEAQKYVDALDQSAPRLFTAEVENSGGVAIANKRAGSVSLSGVQFKGGGVTQLTAHQFARIRDHKMFKAHVEEGTLSLASVDALAKAL